MDQVTESRGPESVPGKTTWESIGESLSNAFESAGLSRLGLGAVVLASAVMLGGCSPQEKSYLYSSYTDLPPPPAEARMQLGASTEEDGTVFINYVIWDGAAKEFVRKDIHYTTTITHPGTFSSAGGYQQNIHHGAVLYGDAIVNQKEGKIHLSNGNVIDGKTGNIQDASGRVLFER